jgi:hypothetical protein
MLRESLTFITRHWWHVLLFVPGALAVTTLHELAHALAVIVEGGTVTEFVWLPSAGEWGHVAYVFPDGAAYSQVFIAAAPYMLWVTVALLTGLFACRSRGLSFGGASILFAWFFVIPLGDIANAAFPYLKGERNDLWFTFGPPSIVTASVIALAAAMAIAAGYPVQARLYRENRLRPASYLALSGLTLFALLTLTLVH